MSSGGGIFQPECRLITYAHYAMKGLGLKFEDDYLYMAAFAVKDFVSKRYGNMPFPGHPDYQLYQTYNGAAHIMNQILLYDAKGWNAINDY